MKIDNRGRAPAPPPPSCPHTLARRLLKTSKSTATHTDGAARTVALRGGRMVTVQDRCTLPAGHHGEHRTGDGRTW